MLHVKIYVKLYFKAIPSEYWTEIKSSEQWLQVNKLITQQSFIDLKICDCVSSCNGIDIMDICKWRSQITCDENKSYVSETYLWSSSHGRWSIKKVLLKLRKVHKKTPLLESLF